MKSHLCLNKSLPLNITLPLSLAFILLLSSCGPEPKTAYIRPEDGKVNLYVDGNKVNPSFYALTHAYGARWSWEEVPQRNLKNFGDIGIRLFQLDLYFEDIWYKDQEKLDIEKAQRQVRGLLDVCPDAAVVIRVHVNAPYWWNDMYPEECTAYADGPTDQRAYGPPFNNEDGDVDRAYRASLASMKWRSESGEKLKEFCKRMAATTEGKSVIGIHVSGGIYGEWHYWGFIGHDPDTGPAMTKYFREWLKNKYGGDTELQKAWNRSDFTLTNATVPDKAERDFAGDGVFRDPVREQRVIDYFMAQQEVVCEDIEYFTKIVRDTWPRDLIIGVFYGYFHMTFCRQASGGHLYPERILDCPTVDYLSAPQSYWGATTNLGGSGNSRGIIESAALHGKLWLDELDNGGLQKKTALDPVRNSGKWDPQYLPVFQRSAAFPLMRGVGFWYYDFGPRESFGWWDNSVYLEAARRNKNLFDSLLKENMRSAADILYVWDQESFFYVKNRWTPVCYNLLDQAPEEAMRSGTAGDHIYLFDLKRIDPEKYKAIVFMNVNKMSDADKDIINNKIAKNGRTLIWNYMPGYTNGEMNSFSFTSGITGFSITPYECGEKAPEVTIKDTDITYKMDGPISPMAVITDPEAETIGTLSGTNQVVMARKKMAEYTSVYSTLPIHTSDLYRNIFREAGCHIYSETDEFTYANNKLVMIHSKEGGKRSIYLRNGKIAELDLPPLSNWIIDAETGNALLK